MNIRILLADDHVLFRQGLRAMLHEHPEMQVVGDADTGRQAIRLAREVRPDVVLMDVGMPDMNGVEATHRILSEVPRAKVLALSMHLDRHFVHQMLKAGASGYLLKDTVFEDLVRALHAVVADQGFLSPKVADLVIKGFAGGSGPDNLPPAEELSKREREVLQLVAEGKSSKEIASTLCISTTTVENHRKHIMQKLDIHNIAELTKYAVKRGLTSI